MKGKERRQFGLWKKISQRGRPYKETSSQEVLILSGCLLHGLRSISESCDTPGVFVS